MINATRKWLQRNRTNFAIGFGVLGIGYVAGQYVLSKIAEAGERMSSDRTAKENLRRRFQQNQEDCTLTVLALIPAAAEKVVGALPVESITKELQQKKAERLRRITEPSETVRSELSSRAPSVVEEDGRSLASLQSESYVHASQMGAPALGKPDLGARVLSKSKAQLWNELKINSITRVFTLLYSLSLLTLLTRIQLNLLGRRNYLSSVVSASHPPKEKTIRLENRDDDNVEQPYNDDFQTNRKFLTFSWWLLHRGWREIIVEVQAAVTHVFGPLNPTEDIQVEQLSTLILDVRRIIEGNTPEERKSRKWLSCLLPPPDQEDSVLREAGMDIHSTPPPTATTINIPSPSSSPAPHSSSTTVAPPLRRLLDETSDLIDSPAFSEILTQLLDATFSHLTDQNLRSQAFKLPLPLIQERPSSSPPNTANLPGGSSAINSNSKTNGEEHYETFQEINPRAKLASILAVMTRQAHVIGNGVPNEYVQVLDEVRDLEAFAAVVYSSHFELEALRANATMGDTECIPSPRGGYRDTAESDKSGDERKSGAVGQSTGAFESVWNRAVASVLGKG